MKNKTKAILVVVIFGFLLYTSGTSWNQSMGVVADGIVTPLLLYQGRLTDPTTGEIVADGSDSMSNAGAIDMHPSSFIPKSKFFSYLALREALNSFDTVLTSLWVSSMSRTAAAELQAQNDIDCSTVSEIPQAECEALTTLYNSTDGPNWTNDNDWLVTTTPCNWYGVTCYLGHVIQIDLTSNQLNGSIPPDLQNLPNLVYLYLRSNQLSGTIPPELGNLPNLLDLWLAANQLDGTIPQSLGNLSNLKTLWLDTNQLSGDIPSELGDLSNLTYLGLRFNQLSGPIPPQLGNLANLTELRLSSNQLNDAIPAQLGNLSNLTHLYLRDNQLSGAIPTQLSNLSNLRELSLSINQLNGAIPSELGNLSMLEGLWLWDNQLSGTIPPELGNLGNLSELWLASNQLDGAIPTQLGNLSNLKKLALYDNQLIGAIPVQLGNLPMLESLWLQRNRLSGSIPSELSHLTTLLEIDLSRNQLSGTIPSTLTNLSNLPFHVNDLGYNKLSASDPALLSFLTAMDNDWADTQTVPPIDLQATSQSSRTIQLTWTPILYTDDNGYYEIGYSTSSGGPYTIHGTTSSKNSSEYTVTDLSPDTTYYFMVRAYTPAHDTQKNALTSDFSQVSTAHTPPDLSCYTLTLIHSGSGSDPVASPAQSASCADNGQYVGGEAISLSAIPAAGTSVSGWIGTTDDTSISNTNSLTMPTDDHTVTVIYVAEPDAYEVDNVCGQAHLIELNGSLQEHTFHVAADADWVHFDATADTQYRIEVQTPVDSAADVNLGLYPACDLEPTYGFEETFTPGVRLDFPAQETGTVYLRLTNFDPNTAGSDVAYHLSVRELQPDAQKGAVILLAGRLKVNDHLQPNIHHVINTAYNHYKQRGYNDDQIHYLAVDPSLPGSDQGATVANLREAITTWAVDKVGPEQPLVLYLMDHGDVDQIFVDEVNQQNISPNDLNLWLDQLEAAVPGVEVMVIIEACNSGSFIDGYQSVSKQARLVISSTNAKNVAFASADGAQFSDHFLTSLSQDYGICMSFRNAQDAVQQLSNIQEPWIDANGNKVPNEAADCEAANLQITVSGLLPEDSWAPYIVMVEGPENIADQKGIISAQVRDNKAVARVWAVVYTPSYVAPTDGQELVPEDMPSFDLVAQGNEMYSAEFTHFDELGSYRIAIYAKDESGLKTGPYVIETQNSEGEQVFLPIISR